MLGVLTPELEALRNERAAAANCVAPKPKRVRYKNVRVARVAASVLSPVGVTAPHDPGDAPWDGAVEANPVTFEIPLVPGSDDRAPSSVDDGSDRCAAGEAISTLEDEAFLDLPFDMFGDDYFLADMTF